VNPPIEACEGGVLIRLRVQPKASRDAVVFEENDRVRVALTAPPVEGAANTALVRFMAKFLGVKRRELTLRSGERSRDKTLFLEEGTVEQVRRRLEVCRR
jgi:uncharacterized protein